MKRRHSSGKRGQFDGQDSRQYIRQTGRVPPMSLEQEVAATTEYARTRDPRVARQIATANLRLVIRLAVSCAGPAKLSLADLVQEGSLGLMKAIELFDPKRGVRFATYATWWIRAYLLKYLIDNARLVRAGRSRKDRRGFFNGQRPPAELSLDAPADAQDRSVSLVDQLTDPMAARPDQAVEDAELIALFRARADAFNRTLRPRDALVFRERFLCDEAAPLSALATRLAVSKERVRQIEKALLDDFRQFAHAADRAKIVRRDLCDGAQL